MFTGIVMDVGRCERVQGSGAGQRLTVGTGLATDDFELGESVAVNGVCLTVVSFGSGRFEADVSPETLRRSTLGGLRPGHSVNLERALRPIDRLGGHFVLGHVDATGKVSSVRTDAEFRVLTFDVPGEVLRYVVEKGSIAVDGVSLTVSALSGTSFSVAAIPHTLERTTLIGRRAGDRVNIEVDVLGKYVEKLLGKRSAGEGVTVDLLARSGFFGN